MELQAHGINYLFIGILVIAALIFALLLYKSKSRIGRFEVILSTLCLIFIFAGYERAKMVEWATQMRIGAVLGMDSNSIVREEVIKVLNESVDVSVIAFYCMAAICLASVIVIEIRKMRKA
jgi:hypothetical protein